MENASVKQNKFLSLEEAAKYIGIAKGTLYRYNTLGLIPYSKPTGCKIYYKVEDLDAFMQQNRIESVMSKIENSRRN